MNKWLEIFIGLVFIIVPVILVLPGMRLESWGIATAEFLKGAVTCGAILIGLLLIILGISELRE